MSTETMAGVAQESADGQLHSPPASTGSGSKESPSHKNDGSDSELSDIEDPTDDIGEIVPDHYADDGRVPVFKPTMDQFKSFERYMKKINPYGMKSGIVKVIPPPEWKATQPRLDEVIKTIRVREPIKQDIMGTSGTYRQANILHQRSYNLPQWRQLCEQSEHQPPARRGERRLNQDKPAPPRSAPKPRAAPGSAKSKKKGSGRSTKGKSKVVKENLDGLATPDRLPTPVSPTMKPEDEVDTIKSEIDDDDDDLHTPKRVGSGRGGRGGGRGGQSISVSSRRKYSRREASAKVDEAAFKDFEYELISDEYTPERCEELERAYWKTLTYAPPLYGADMLGTLFDDRTTTWNLSKLENLLDVLGTKIPGVNTAYLYLGMWKATFAWHLEDVDLYSINYVHFGAPKQWYSISQGDARRFENAMKTIWPTDAKACDQFLRHKTFLISPSRLLQDFNIKVNKIVAHPGEFVITFPYGYHSGYNLGYNCAEAVNFALESWLEYGRVAKKCDCDQAQDSVWIDVREIDRKLRGEETDFEETEDEEEEEEDDDGSTDLPTPPESSGDIKIKIKMPKKKRKRPVNDKAEQGPVKKIRVRFKVPTREPCILCPNDIPSEPLLPTEEGEQAHRMCALYIPETSIDSGDKEVVTDIKYINKARLELKCNYCRSKKGACFQCSQKKCTRAYHATCAAAAGVFVEQGEIPVFGEDGTEYKDWGIEFSCRFHRTKRDKKLEADELSENKRISTAAAALKVGDICQMQYYRGDIFAGAVVENRSSEEMILVDILPRGDRIEVEYKWLLVPDPADFRIQKPSANAIPMPKSFKAKESLNTSKRQIDDLPRKDDIFFEGFTWSEFHNPVIPRNPHQVKIDFSKDNQIWYYLGKNSTEARAQFTEDLANPRHNPKGHFLDTIQKAVVSAPRPSYGASYPTNHSQHSTMNAFKGGSRPAQPVVTNSAPRQEKPYVYKPRIEDNNEYRIDAHAYRSQQNFLQRAQTPAIQFGTDPRWQAAASSTPVPFSTASAAPPNTQFLSHNLPTNYNNIRNSQAPYGTPVSNIKPPQKAAYPPPGQPHNSSTRPQHDFTTSALHGPGTTSNTAARDSAAIQYTPMSKPPYSSTVAPQTRDSSYGNPVNSVLAPPPSRGPLAPPAQYPPQHHAQSSMPMNPFSGRPPTTPKPNVFRLYSYLQKEHNRSPLEYKSPYRPGGGFMNGYQGNLQKHLQQQFANKSGHKTSTLLTYGNAQTAYTPSQVPVAQGRPSYSSTTPSHGGYGISNGMSTGHTQPGLPPHQVTKAPSLDSWEQKDKFHAAIREEYAKPYASYNTQASTPTPSQILTAVPHSPYDRHQAQNSQQHHRTTQPAQRTSHVLQPPQPYQHYHSHAGVPSHPSTPAQPVYHNHGFPNGKDGHSGVTNPVLAAPLQRNTGTYSASSQPVMAPPVHQYIGPHSRTQSSHSASPVSASPGQQYANTQRRPSNTHSTSPISVPPQYYQSPHDRPSSVPSPSTNQGPQTVKQNNPFQYQASPQPSIPSPLYAHQQYFQKAPDHGPASSHSARPQSQLGHAPFQEPPSVSKQSQSLPSQIPPEIQATAPSVLPSLAHEVIDVPADSASVVERMMMNLKRLPQKNGIETGNGI